MALKYHVVDEPRGKGWTQFMAIFNEEFKGDKMDSNQLIMDKIRSRRYIAILAREGSTVVGGILFSYFRALECGYISFAVVDKRQRSKGIGRGLFAETVRVLGSRATAEGGTVRAIFAEVQHGRALEHKARVRFWRREGFRLLDVDWETPLPTALRMMVRGDIEWTPLDLVPVWHAIFQVGFRHLEDYDTRLRWLIRGLIRKPLEKNVART